MPDAPTPTSQAQTPPTPIAPEAATQAPAQPAAAPVAQPTPPAAPACKCPTINPADWDKKHLNFTKSFYKTFSPRLFHMPISYAIDIDRATKAAVKKGYKTVEKPMVLDIDGTFMGSVLVEVENADKLDKNIVSFENTDVYCKVSTLPLKDVQKDVEVLKTEIGKQPRELYVWYIACPRCEKTKNEKAVIIAVP